MIFDFCVVEKELQGSFVGIQLCRQEELVRDPQLMPKAGNPINLRLLSLLQREEVSEETPRTGSEAELSGANAGRGGNAEVGALIDSGAMRSAVLEALSDPAVVRQLAAAISNSSTSSASTSASTHESTTER